MDEWVRLVAEMALGAAAVASIVGGVTTKVAGRWRDGGRPVSLRQTAFVVRGAGEVFGGLQVYRGFACFGRLWLWRHDYGARHLQALGFAADQLPALEGQITGLFRLRLDGAGELVGTFSGKRFAFAGGRLRQAHFLPPEPRAWRRDT